MDEHDYVGLICGLVLIVLIVFVVLGLM